MSHKASKLIPLTEANDCFNRKMSSIRTCVEYVLGVIKRQFSYTKVGYKESARNAAQVFPWIDLTNLHLARRACLS